MPTTSSEPGRSRRDPFCDWLARAEAGTREPLARSFDQAAEIYDRARPAYPEELFADLIDMTGLRPGSRLLEIGCATGKATRPLLERGFSITCVEPGAQLAERARGELASFRVEIETANFEERQGPAHSFDLVYAATSWHWLDPAVRYRKAHQLLRPGGHLAFWSALHAFPANFDPFFTEIQEVYEQIGEGFAGDWPPPPPEQIPAHVDEIIASGLFADARVRRYVWATHYTAEEYIALLDTFSGHIAMAAEKRARLDEEIRARINKRPDRRLRRHWYAILHVARAKDS